MNEAQFFHLAKNWEHRLGLDRWRIEWRIQPCDSSSSYMECMRSCSYERASISVQPWLFGGEVPEDVMFSTFDDQFIEESLVHELLHCLTRDLRAVVRDDLEGQVHRDVHAQMDIAAERAEEQLVDKLACALVKAWPRRVTAVATENGRPIEVW